MKGDEMSRFTPKKGKSKPKPQQQMQWNDRDIELMAQIQRAIRKQQPIKGAPEGYDPDDPDTWET